MSSDDIRHLIHFQHIPLEQTGLIDEEPLLTDHFEFDLALHVYNDQCDVSMFDQYRYLLNKNFKKSNHLIYYKIEKYILLKKYWLKHTQWRDPVVAVPLGYRYNKLFYRIHPGKDRWRIMKTENVESYNFLVIDLTLDKIKYKSEIDKFWKNSISLTIETPEPNYSLLNNNFDREEFLQLTETAKWLSYNIPIEDYIRLTPREESIKRLQKKSQR